jgi:Na+/melibiose symporter-like transporter
MIAALGMGSGGMMGGVMYNMFGSYFVPFMTSSTTGMISAILALTLPSTVKRETQATPELALAS